MVANVQRGNRHADKLIEILRNVQPDILVAQETDEWWDRQLSALSDLYPHTEAVITGSYYGMHLFSRSPIVEAEVVYPADPETPAIVARVALPGGAINLIGLHPRPPHPQQSTAPRDAELLWAALHVQRGAPTILAGDLNAVPWESTVARMRRIAAFDAKSLWMKWPLDQVLHTAELSALEAEVHVPFGSDHHPYSVVFCQQPSDRVAPKPTARDLTQARATLTAAKK
jgi:endonuclease/exonuclease/phosphatase (EEP) superfamily protein YafD